MSDDEFADRNGESNDGSEGQRGLIRYSLATGALDTAFDLLRSARRRYLLYYLSDIDGDVTDVDGAVDAVCAYEARGTRRDGFPRREKVLIDLHHDQIPRLEGAGIVDYDRRQGTIRFRGAPSLDGWLERARRMELG